MYMLIRWFNGEEERRDVLSDITTANKNKFWSSYGGRMYLIAYNYNSELIEEKTTFDLYHC